MHMVNLTFGAVKYTILRITSDLNTNTDDT